jgi:hypothetical protein
VAGSIATKYVALWQPVTIQAAQFRGTQAKFQGVFYMRTHAQAVAIGSGVIGCSGLCGRKAALRWGL